MLHKCGKQPIEILEEDDILPAVQQLGSDRVCPLFMVSCVNGTRLNLLYAFLNVLPARYTVEEREDLMQLSTFFQVRKARKDLKNEHRRRQKVDNINYKTALQSSCRF